jgi:TRAP-type C4-dicarboxylate transport system permease small subunit
MSDISAEITNAQGAVERPAPLNNVVATICEWLCCLTLGVMLLIISAEAVARLFGKSLEMADEVGGYLLVAISFLSLSVCQVSGAFHHLELLQPKLTKKSQAIWAITFDLISLSCTIVIFWQLCRLEMQSWAYGDVAPTELQTPLWLPRLSMPVGVGALALVLFGSLIASIRRFVRTR